jgi:hypothetical protein
VTNRRRELGFSYPLSPKVGDKIERRENRVSLAHCSENIMARDRLLVADPRLRPSVPETFASDEEYTRTFVGFMLEEIRQEASEAIEAREPISAFWVQALDEHKVSRPETILGLAIVTSVRLGCGDPC